jgi:hypothetical protein
MESSSPLSDTEPDAVAAAAAATPTIEETDDVAAAVSELETSVEHDNDLSVVVAEETAVVSTTSPSSPVVSMRKTSPQTTSDKPPIVGNPAVVVGNYEIATNLDSARGRTAARESNMNNNNNIIASNTAILPTRCINPASGKCVGSFHSFSCLSNKRLTLLSALFNNRNQCSFGYTSRSPCLSM